MSKQPDKLKNNIQSGRKDITVLQTGALLIRHLSFFDSLFISLFLSPFLSLSLFILSFLFSCTDSHSFIVSISFLLSLLLIFFLSILISFVATFLVVSVFLKNSLTPALYLKNDNSNDDGNYHNRSNGTTRHSVY